MSRKIENFGVMIDSSRNAVMTVPQIKKFMQLVKKMGYTRFYLYIEDTYEVEGEPRFGYLRGRYSKAELKEIDNIGAEIGIEVVPIIQTLGHFNQLMQWPEYQEICDAQYVLLVDDERTYALLDKMISTISECFRTKLIHIGEDEAFAMGSGKYKELHGEVDKVDVLLRHLNRVSDILEKYDLEAQFWCGTLLHFIYGEQNPIDDAPYDERLITQIPKRLHPDIGGYYNYHREGTAAMLERKLRWMQGLGRDDVGFVTASWLWQGFYPHNQLANGVLYESIKACEACGVDTLYTTLWGDDGAEASVYSMLPNLAYSACIAYGITDENEIKAKFKEWVGVEYDDFMLLDKLDFAPDYMLGYILHQPKYHLYNDCFLGKFDSMVAEYDPKNYATYAKEILAAKERANEYAYVFDFIGKLANVLALKADIGIRTRKIYESEKREGLDELIADYKEMIKRTREFYEAFRTRWYTENKPQGFEVQDLRIGGLIMRMENCMRTLCDLRDGKISVIPELEEKLLPYVDKDRKRPKTGVVLEGAVEKTYVNWWQEMITTGLLSKF